MGTLAFLFSGNPSGVRRH